MKFNVYGIEFNSITHLSKVINISSSNILKQIKKLYSGDDIEEGVRLFFESYGQGFTYNGIKYPTFLLGLINLGIPLLHYKAYIGYTGDNFKNALDYFTSEDYQKHKLPICFEGKYYISLTELCKDKKVNYTNVKTNASRYHLSFKEGLIKELTEINNNMKNKNYYNDESKYTIFGTNFRSKEAVMEHFNVSTKTILKFQKENNLDFEEAVEKYLSLSENGSYIVEGIKHNSLASVYQQLGTTKSIFHKTKTKLGISTEEAIEHFLKIKPALNTNQTKLNRINIQVASSLAYKQNKPVKEMFALLNKAYIVNSSYNSLSDYQKKIFNTLCDKSYAVLIKKIGNEIPQINIIDLKYSINISKSKIGLENIRMTSIQNLIDSKLILNKKIKNEDTNNFRLFEPNAEAFKLLNVFRKYKEELELLNKKATS